MPDIKYQRLTRTRTRSMFSVASASRSSLWLGPDHLLCVDFNGYSESYKRFYFADIQVITVRETSRRSIWNIVLMVPLLISLVGVMIYLVPWSEHTGAVIGWSIPAVIFLIPFIINNILGTACSCQLRTAVQTEDLASLSRVRKTRQVLDRIRPLIAAAQGGELTAEMIDAQMRRSAASPLPTTAAEPVPEDPNAPPRLTS